jgi:hypothetical protein
MFSLLRNRFGIPGVIATIALVFAMLGGAYAASKGLTAKEKKEVKAIAKKFQGTGPAGPAGAKGDTGAPGKDGTGATGTTFSGSKTIPPVTCTEGGIEVKSGSPAVLVCNGKEGSPWTAGGTLPQGATLTGGFTAPDGGEVTRFVPISFGIRLANPPTPVVVKPGEDKSPEGCSSTYTGGSLQGWSSGCGCWKVVHLFGYWPGLWGGVRHHCF